MCVGGHECHRAHVEATAHLVELVLSFTSVLVLEIERAQVARFV